MNTLTKNTRNAGPRTPVRTVDGPAGTAPPPASPATAYHSAQFDWLIGSVCLYGGLGVFALAVIDGLAALPFPMPDLWYGNRVLCAFLALVAIVLGTALVRREPRLEWRPTRPGRRFDSVVLYTRAGCHLCDEARELLLKYRRWIPAPVEVDIDGDPELREQFTTCVPVVQFDGRVRFRGLVSEVLLRRLIEGTPPETQRGAIAFKAGCGSGCGCGPQTNRAAGRESSVDSREHRSPGDRSCEDPSRGAGSCGAGSCGSDSCGSDSCGSDSCGEGSCGCGRGRG